MKATKLRDWLDRQIKAGGDFEVELPSGDPIRKIEMLSGPRTRKADEGSERERL